MKLSIKKTYLILIISLLMPACVHAADLGFAPDVVSPNQSQSFVVSVVVGSAEPINAIEGQLLVKSPLSVKEINIGSSIVTYWVKQPVWDPVKKTISFGGTIPGGYNGKNGVLFNVIFNALNSSDDTIDALKFIKTQALINDGLGSVANINTTTLSIKKDTEASNILKDIELYADDYKKDSVPPEVFYPQVSRDDRVYVGKWFIVFSTTDKQSGVDRYEIQESKSGNIDSQKWKIAESPYVLEDQQLQSYIYVTAIDKQGNERIIKVSPKYLIPWYDKYKNALYVLGLFLIIIVIFIVKRFIYKKNELEV